MEQQQLEQVLSELHFSSPLSAQVLRELADVAGVRQFAAGSVVFREGSEDRNLYVLSQGRVALDMNVPGRGPARILTLGPGDMLGWSAALGEGKMTATAVVLEDMQAIAVPGQKLAELCETNYEIGYQVMRRMAEALAQRLLATRLQLLDLFSNTPPPIREPQQGGDNE